MMRGKLLGMPVPVGGGISPVGVGTKVMLEEATSVVAAFVPIGIMLMGADDWIVGDVLREPGTEPCMVAVASGDVDPVLGIGKGKLKDVPVVGPVGTLVSSLPEAGAVEAPVGALLNSLPEGELGDAVPLE